MVRLIRRKKLLLFCHCCADIFSQIADPTGIMIYSQFDQFLKEVLKLPVTVFEGPSFSYTEQTARNCFAQQVGTIHILQTPPSCGTVGEWNDPAVPVSIGLSFVCLLTETGYSKHVPGHLHVRSSATVSCMVAPYASAGECGKW